MVKEITIDGYIGDLSDFMMGGNYFTLADMQRELANMPADTERIHITINSGGGSSIEGFAIHDLLAAQTIPVDTEILGLCGSIATIIAQAPKTQGLGGTRKMHLNSEFFIHNGSYVPSAPIPHNAADLENIKSELVKLDTRLLDFYVNVSGSDRNWLQEKMAAETTLSSEEAKAHGLIDEIIGKQITAYTKYKLVAITTNKNQSMADNKETLTALGRIEKLINSVFKRAKLNMTVKTTEGIDIYFDGELGVGTPVFIDEAMTTPAPDGVHTYDGKVYTVAGGVVTEVSEVQAQKTELELANEKIADLTAQLTAKEGEITAAKDEVAKVNAAVEEIQKEFVALKNTVVTGKDAITVAADVNRNDKGQFAKSAVQLLAEKRAAADAAKK